MSFLSCRQLLLEEGDRDDIRFAGGRVLALNMNQGAGRLIEQNLVTNLHQR